MMEKGYKIVGIAEYDGGLYNANGIDIISCWNTNTETAQPSVSAAQRT